MKHFSLPLFLLTAFFIFSSARADDFMKDVALRFAEIWHFSPQEKLYVHTDKPYYSAGETLWFAAYLTNAATHITNTKSRYIYVELLDVGDSAVARVKILRDSVGFQGYIKLQPEMPAGMYTFRAYSYWMQNAPKEFFFAKQIFIGNDIDKRVNCAAVFGTADNNELSATLTFTDVFGLLIENCRVSVTQNWGKGNTRDFVTDKNGKIRLTLKFDETTNDKKFLHLKIKEKGFNFDQKTLLPELAPDFDIQFMPESGVFLDNQIQNLAFKAIGSNGFGIDVSGKIFNQNNEEITEFSSVHKGMGRIVFKTNPDNAYYALVKTADGAEKRFELPATEKSGVTLHLSYNRGKVFFQTVNETSVPSASLYLLIHSRGVVLSAFPLAQTEGSLSENLLPAGINSFSVIDTLGNVYCERLYFSRNFNFPTISMNADRKFYGKRAPVSLDFQVLDEENKPIEGQFSVSVTDSRNVVADTLHANILNFMLLTSDLQGYVEEPNRYFADNSNATRERTDILMLTQGWRRFNTADIMKRKYPENTFYLEAGQAVSGKVMNIFGKPAKKRPVIAFSSYRKAFGLTETDDNGRFVIDGIEFPDSTKIVLKAKSKTALVDVELVADADKFPQPQTNIPFRNPVKADPPKDYFQIIREKYYTEGGMMLVNLEGITVSARRQRDSQEAFYASSADNVITSETIEEMAGLTVFDMLSTIAGVQVNGQDVSIRGGGTPLFLIDGIEINSIEDVYFLNTSDIQNIYVYKTAISGAMFGLRGGNGTIVITLKRGEISTYRQPVSLAHITPLGFQKPDTFYVPRYDVDSIYRLHANDLRTTIYWNPEVVTDKAGKATVKFFTADKANDYDVILEGIGKNGEICRYRGSLKR